MKKATLKNIIKYLLGVAFIIGGLYWFFRNWDQLETLVNVRFSYILTLMPLIFLSMLMVGFINQLIVSHLGYPLKLMQWTSLAFASTLANYIFPMRAGMALRATYFKKCYNFPLNQFAASMAFAYILTFISNAALGLLIMLWLGVEKQGMRWILILIFTAVFLGGCFTLIYNRPVRKAQSKMKIISYLAKIQGGWSVLRKNPSLLIKCSSLIIINTILFSIRLFIAFCAIGQSVNFAGCLLAGCFAAVSMFISITPASLGIRETAIVFASSVVGVTPEISLLAASLDRAVSLVVVAIFGTAGMIKISHETADVSN